MVEDDENDDEISALLTPKQREYLQGNSNIEDKSAQERMVRSRIRNRLSMSMRDMVLLQKELEPRDVEKTFDLAETDHIRHAIALMFRGAFRGSPRTIDAEVDDEETLRLIEDFVTMGLEGFYLSLGEQIANQGNPRDYTPDIETIINVGFGEDVELTDISQRTLIELLDNKIDLYELSNEELIELLKHDIISNEEFESAYSKADGSE